MKLFMNRKTIIVMSLLLMLPAMGAVAQRVLGLDSLRRLALQNNKQLLSGQAQMEAADYTQRAAKTAYLPKVSADAAYIHNSRSTHLLSKDTRETLGSAGETAGSKLQALAQQIAQQSPEMAQLLGSLGTPLVQAIGSAGQGVVDAFRTSTYNVYAGSLLLTQPLYMGGRIKALDRMAGYTRQLLGAQYDQTTQDVIYSVDQAYWQVVSLAQKRRLAESYVKLLQKLDDDVQKMLREGVATKATSLTVGVKLNEAEMTLTKVEDGLSLSRMLLYQICGLDLTEPVTLADEGAEHVETALSEVQADTVQAFSKRKDLEMLEQAVKLADENVKVVRSLYLPSLSAFGAYTLTNPNVYNGFQNKFGGNLSVGVALHVPLWTWGEGRYRVRAAKSLARSQRYLYDEAKEKINLQLNQAQYKVNEAQKKLLTTQKNEEKANENLHYADVGFHEGVIAAADLLEAQTAWLQARSERVDAEIDVKMTELYLNKVMGNVDE